MSFEKELKEARKMLNKDYFVLIKEPFNIEPEWDDDEQMYSETLDDYLKRDGVISANAYKSKINDNFIDVYGVERVFITHLEVWEDMVYLCKKEGGMFKVTELYHTVDFVNMLRWQRVQKDIKAGKIEPLPYAMVTVKEDK